MLTYHFDGVSAVHSDSVKPKLVALMTICDAAQPDEIRCIGAPYHVLSIIADTLGWGSDTASSRHAVADATLALVDANVQTARDPEFIQSFPHVGSQIMIVDDLTVKDVLASFAKPTVIKLVVENAEGVDMQKKYSAPAMSRSSSFMVKTAVMVNAASKVSRN